MKMLNPLYVLTKIIVFIVLFLMALSFPFVALVSFIMLKKRNNHRKLLLDKTTEFLKRTDKEFSDAFEAPRTYSKAPLKSKSVSIKKTISTTNTESKTKVDPKAINKILAGAVKPLDSKASQAFNQKISTQ